MRNLYTRLIQWLAVRHGFIHKDAITVSGEYIRADKQPFGPNSLLDADEAELSEYGRKLREEERQRRIEYIVAECNRLQFHPVEEARIPLGDDAKTRGDRWERFAREEGGLYDMIEAMRREAFEAAADVPPEDVDKLQYWAMSDRITRRLKQRVDSVIATGKIEAERDKLRHDLRIIKSA